MMNISSQAISYTLSRNVLGIFGIPVDNVDFDEALSKIADAAVRPEEFLLSTPNLNFLMLSEADPDFRESLLSSDLSTADGMPLIWLSHLCYMPIKMKVSGSDLFDALRTRSRIGRPIRVFLFGGADGLAQQAADQINSQRNGRMTCVGAISPGFGTVEELSKKRYIDEINASGADFCVISLGAQKGQAWIIRNRRHLTVPVRSHLGAALNFCTGTVSRAPLILRKVGLEWLWRIKEEPYLWRRYLNDGVKLVLLLVRKAAPLAVYRVRLRLRPAQEFSMELKGSDLVRIVGPAIQSHINAIVPEFARVISANRDLRIDLSEATWIDARFFGLLMMARKVLRERQKRLLIVGSTAETRYLFRLNGASFLLDDATTN